MITARYWLLALAIGLISPVACARPPEARFAVSTTAGEAPLSLTFTNESSNAGRFEWDFGDGTTTITNDKKEVVTHEYTKAGAHTVTLTAVKVEEGEPEETSSITLSVSVEPAPLDKIVLNITEVTLSPTQGKLFSAQAFDRFGNSIPGLTFAFHSAAEAGQIDSQGRFTAGTKPGTYDGAVTVEVTQGTVTRRVTANVIIEPGPLDHVKLEPASTSLEVTKEKRFSTQAFDRFENPIPGLTYSFRADVVAGQVDSQGRFTAGTKAGTYDDAVTVEVTQGAVTRRATANVTIEPGPLDHVKLEPATAAVEVTKEQQFTATALDQFENSIPGLTFTFRSPKRAGQVDSQGRFTAGTKAGTYEDAVTVGVTQGSITRSTTLEVIVQPGPLAIVSVKPAKVTLDIDGSQAFSFVATDRFGNEVRTISASWRVETPGLGGIDPTGLFTAGIKAGAFPGVIRVDLVEGPNTASATADLVIRPDPLVRVRVTPAAAFVRIGATVQFSATGFDKYGNAIPDLQFTWEATGGLIVSVDRQTAEFSGGAPGSRYEVKTSAVFKEQQRSGSAVAGVPPAWIPAGNMSVPRRDHISILLLNGKVLILGGAGQGVQLPTALLYDPATRAFTPTGRSNCVQQSGLATLLADGRVLVVGGHRYMPNCAEVYDPGTGVFTRTGAPAKAHPYGSATLLSDGRVLVAGGSVPIRVGLPDPVTTAEIFDPKTGTFSSAGDWNTPRQHHTAVLLRDGNVLIVGGFQMNAQGNTQELRSAELYVPASGTFHELGNMMITGHMGMNWDGILLKDGRVLIAGGNTSSAEIFDPATLTFSATGNMVSVRYLTTATLLLDGRVLFVGGTVFGDSASTNSAEVYDPATGTFSSTASMMEARQQHTATLLPSGEVLVVGGYGITVTELTSAEAFLP
jgi:PKD repeat protein